MGLCSGGRCWGVGKWKRVGSEPLAVKTEDCRPETVGSEQPLTRLRVNGQLAVRWKAEEM